LLRPFTAGTFLVPHSSPLSFSPSFPINPLLPRLHSASPNVAREEAYSNTLHAKIATCNADSTPLYTFGDNTAGDGQLHKCRDWDALRAYAAEHTACYRDTVEDVLLGEHFGYCDDGDDGLVEAGRVKVLIP